MKLSSVLGFAAVAACSVCNAFVAPTAFAGARVPTLAAARVQAPRTGASDLSMTIKIIVGEGESVEHAMGRFRRDVMRSGHLGELRHRRTFETTQEKKKRKAEMARRRERIMRAKMRKFQESQYN